MKKFTYFISFFVYSPSMGFGNTKIITDKPITMDDIVNLPKKGLWNEKGKIENFTVLYFQLLSEEEV